MQAQTINVREDQRIWLESKEISRSIEAKLWLQTHLENLKQMLSVMNIKTQANTSLEKKQASVQIHKTPSEQVVAKATKR